MREDAIEEVDTPKSCSNLEIRGEDIRAATSMMKKDRSPKLPTPTAVSDRAGRPIVSFDPAWKPPGDSPRNSQDTSRPVIKLTESPRTSRDLKRPLLRPVPSISEPVNSAPVVPTINVPGNDANVPSISFPDGHTNMPTIRVEDSSGPSIAISAPSEPTSQRPPPKPAPRPLPKHSSTTPAKLPSAKTSRLPWLNGGPSAVPTVTCSSCALPISGRVVTASGSSTANSSLRARFHPECFSCDHCSTPLECVSFYPEPDDKRAERLEAEGIATGTPDAEMDVRFYCHPRLPRDVLAPLSELQDSHRGTGHRCSRRRVSYWPLLLRGVRRSFRLGNSLRGAQQIRLLRSMSYSTDECTLSIVQAADPG